MPNILEVRHLIRASEPEQWYVVPIIGPTYLNAFGMVNSSVEHREHVQRAVYGGDVSLGIAWGMSCGGHEEWEESPFPDRTVDNEYVDVLWCSMLIDRIIVTAADGGRVLLPPAEPEIVSAEPGDYEHSALIGEHASDWDTHLTRLVHVLSGRPYNDFDVNMRIARISYTEPPSDEPRTERLWKAQPD
jgi:hypothetical protein